MKGKVRNVGTKNKNFVIYMVEKIIAKRAENRVVGSCNAGRDSRNCLER